MPNQPPHTAPMPKPQLVFFASNQLVDCPKPQLAFFASFRWLSELKDGKQAAALGYKNLGAVGLEVKSGTSPTKLNIA